MTQPHTSYFVCFTRRSGSTLLSKALAATGVTGRPEEYLPKEALRPIGGNPTNAIWRQDWYSRPFSESLGNIFPHGTTPNGVFGVKMDEPNLRYLDQVLKAEPGAGNFPLTHRLAGTFPNPRYIWVTRRHKFRQGVSLFRAEQSGAWLSEMNERVQSHELTFNLQLVDQYLRQILREEAAWSEFFTAFRIVPYTVVYEDLVLDYEQTVRRVLDYLQISLPEHYQFPAPQLRKQADELSEEWVHRYYSGMETRHGYERLINAPFLLRSASLRPAFFTPEVRARQVKLKHGVKNVLSRRSRRKIV